MYKRGSLSNLFNNRGRYIISYIQKKALQAGAIGVAGIAGFAIIAFYVAKYKAKIEAELASYEADPTREPRVTIISEENIAQIAQDVALEQLQYISDIELTMNEKLTESQKAQVEVQKFQKLCNDLNAQITSETNRINSVHDPIIQHALNVLNAAQQNEKVKYAEYIAVQNKVSDIKAEIAYFQALHDSHPFSIGAIMDLVNISNLNLDLNAIISTEHNSWLRYLDSQTLKESAESDYNSSLLAKQNDSVHLDQLKRELIAATDSLNTWKIAYQAANNIYNALKLQMEGL